MITFVACLLAASGGFVLRMAIERFQARRRAAAQMASLRSLCQGSIDDQEEGPPPPVHFTSEELAELLSPDYD